MQRLTLNNHTFSIDSAMPTHCDVMRPISHGAFSPKGRCVGTGKRQQRSAFLLSGRVFLDVAVAQETAGIYRNLLAASENTVEHRRNLGSQVRFLPATSKNILCRTPTVIKMGVVHARSMKAMRYNRPAQAALETAIATNRFQQYEASSPRYGHLEDDGSWKTRYLRKVQVLGLSFVCC